MNLDSWRRRHDGPLFALVDAVADSTVLARFYQLSEGEGYPLFASTPFAAQATLGPWLLSDPSPAFMAAFPALRGFYLVSDRPVDVVRRHWQSLIQVIRQGESAWFRFADRRIFLPLFGAMSADERDALLGPCSAIWVDGTGFERSIVSAFRPADSTPWFHLRSHHLAALYDEQRHAYILRRRLWQTMTKMMERHPDPAEAILPILRQANAEGLDPEVLDGVVAGALTLQAGLTLEHICAPLMLTETELMQVKYWLMQHNTLIGVDEWR